MSFFIKEKTEEGGTKKNNRWLPLSFLVLVLLLIATSIASFYFYTQYKKSTFDQAKVNQNEVEQIREKIGKLIELPDEIPTLATINDKAKLEKSAFFNKAENGDKVLLFTNAKKAILYRPSTGKIIDVTVINMTDSTQSTTSSADVQNTQGAEDISKESVPTEEVATPPVETPASPKITLYNGSMKIGVTNGLEDEIIAKFPEVTIEKKEKAVRSDYTETEVIDLSGKNMDMVQKLAEFVGGKVVTELPAGEINPGTDILIIVGQK